MVYCIPKASRSTTPLCKEKKVIYYASSFVEDDWILR